VEQLDDFDDFGGDCDVFDDENNNNNAQSTPDQSMKKL